jgi:dipeptidyl aminopeptidase/acylaminoacyl peptidase
MGEAFAYAEGPGNQGFASFAPDGKWLAYTSDDSGRDEVYVDSFPTRGTRIQVSTNGGTDPRWRRDGSELFFALQNEQTDLVEFYAVDVEKTEDGLNISPPNKLFEVRARVWNQFYDVTADGQRFLMPIRPDWASLPIHIEADWINTMMRRK